ncbi:hypothetical protein [Methanomethylovorans sp.]|uniref:hypothetical protein n=1 Tax=Methanomethylovorans sp. TaxID=2758717 RepID=UPI003D0ABEE1
MGLIKTVIKWVLIVFVLLVLLGALLGGQSDQQTKSTDQQQQEGTITTVQEGLANLPNEYDSSAVQKYEIIKIEDISIKALEKPLSEYSSSELNNLPMNVRMQYRVLLPIGVSETELKSTLIQLVLDETSKNTDIDEISVFAYERKEDSSGAYTLGMLEWCPNGQWDGVTAEIASSNDRSSYAYNIEIKDKVAKPDSIERPTEKDFEIYDYYQQVYSEEFEKLDLSDPYATVNYDIVYQRVADQFGITKEEVDQITKKVALYNVQ